MFSLQERVAAFVRDHDMDVDDLASRLLDLTSEAGELAKAYLEGTGYGERPFVPDAYWAEEIGDTLFSLICVANSTNVDLEEALAQVLGKYEQRLNRKGHAGSGE